MKIGVNIFTKLKNILDLYFLLFVNVTIGSKRSVLVAIACGGIVVNRIARTGKLFCSQVPS